MAVRIRQTRLVFFPVPKVACTSVKSAVLAHNDEKLYSDVLGRDVSGLLEEVHDIFPSTTFGRAVSKPHVLFGDWICLVRDPIERFVSGYRNRVVHHGDLSTTPKRRFVEAGLLTDPDLNSFALDLSSYMQINSGVRHHFMPMCSYLGSHPRLYKWVFDLSEMTTFQSVLQGCGADLQFARMQTGGPELTVRDLTPEATESLRRYYSRDYRVWGSYFASASQSGQIGI